MPDSDTFILAPLRGVTGRNFRNALARTFTPTDSAVAPFIPTVAGASVKPSLLRDIDPEREQFIPVVPQVIGKDPAQLRTLLRAFRDRGYTRADLNAGCPWPFVAKKGRGSGLLEDPSLLEPMLQAGCEEMPNGFSIKVRLGRKDAHTLPKRIELLNQYPLCEITLHPRTAKQMYEGAVDLEGFENILSLCKHPLVYNGDIRTAADWKRLKERFPTVTRWMIGRGLAIDPALVEKIQSGKDCASSPKRILTFAQKIFEETQKEFSGDAPVLGRMKELWKYLSQSLPNGEKQWKRIRICRSASEYQLMVQSMEKEG